MNYNIVAFRPGLHSRIWRTYMVHLEPFIFFFVVFIYINQVFINAA